MDAIPVHGAGGIWGTLAVHLFKWEGVLLSGSSEAAWGFLFNIIGLLAIITWTGTLSFLMFYGLKKVKMLRVEAAAEFKGNLKFIFFCDKIAKNHLIASIRSKRNMICLLMILFQSMK